MRRAEAKPGVRAVCECCTLAVQEHDLCATTLHCKAKRRLSSHSSVFTALHFARHTSSHLKPHFSNSWHTANFYTEKLLHTEARSFCTQKLLHREARSFCAQKLLHTPLHRSFYTEKLLRTEVLTQKCFWMHRAPARHARVLHSCRPTTWPACDHLAQQGQEKTFFALQPNWALFTSFHF